MKKISKDFWENNTFRPSVAYGASQNELKERMHTHGSDGDQTYYNLKVDPAQVFLCWPQETRITWALAYYAGDFLMSRGRHLSLEEARKAGQIDQFCKEHPSQGDAGRFEGLLTAMARTMPASDHTSDPGSSAYYSDTQTPSRTSADASARRERESRESTTSGAPKSPQGR